MGAWGAGIFQDDFARDLQSLYIELACLGFKDDEILNELKSEYGSLQGIDGSTFWIALAVLLTKDGRLIDTVKSRAVELIDSGQALAHWVELVEAGDKSIKQRQEHLEKSKALICGPQPKRKNRRPSKELKERIGKEHSNFPWKDETFYSYRMSSGDYVVFLVKAEKKLLPRVYARVGDKIINKGKAELDQAWLMLMDYRAATPPTKDDLSRLPLFAAKLDEIEMKEWPELHSANLAQWKKRASMSFEEFKLKRRGIHPEMSEKDFQSLYREHITRQTNYFEYYKDPDRAFRLEHSVMFIIDPEYPVPTQRLTDLGVRRYFFHNHAFTSTCWETLDRQLESLLERQR